MIIVETITIKDFTLDQFKEFVSSNSNKELTYTAQCGWNLVGRNSYSPDDNIHSEDLTKAHIDNIRVAKNQIYVETVGDRQIIFKSITATKRKRV